MKPSLATYAFFVLLIATPTSFSQGPPAATGQAGSPKTISGGILNGKAISLPKPPFPPDAAAAGVSGQVSVRVMIDERGNVLTAEAIGGVENVPLRRAAEAAALQAKFSPTLLNGQPVKVSGVITYNFALNPDERFERVKYLGAGFFLTIVRESVDHLDILNPTQAEKTEFSEIVEELSTEMELPMIKGFEKMPIDKRAAAIDSAISSLRTRNLSAAEKWQFEMGEQLGSLFGPWTKLAAKGDAADLSDFDEVGAKKRMANILKLTENAPSDFPATLLAKLKRFSELSSAETLLDPKTMELLEKRLEEFINELTGEESAGTK